MAVFRGRYTQLYLHLVWSTWDRRGMLVAGTRERVYAAMHAECTGLRADPIAIGGMEDHIHVLVRFPTTISIAQLVQQMKGSSSHLIGDRLRWQGGYGAFTVSPRHVPAVRTYVLNQERHHTRGPVHRALEPAGL